MRQISRTAVSWRTEGTQTCVCVSCGLISCLPAHFLFAHHGFAGIRCDTRSSRAHRWGGVTVTETSGLRLRRCRRLKASCRLAKKPRMCPSPVACVSVRTCVRLSRAAEKSPVGKSDLWCDRLYVFKTAVASICVSLIGIGRGIKALGLR